MSRPRVRPTFDRLLTGEPDAVFQALGEALANAEGPCQGQAFADNAILRIRGEKRHVWSPALHVHVEPDAAGNAMLRGRFCPNSGVWTAFIGIYIALASIAIAAACYGYAQITLDETPWAFLAIPISLVLAGFTYGAAFIGQGLGSEDMFELRTFVERVLDSVS